MRIVITGPKGAGKTSVGELLAERLEVEFVDTDDLIERLYLSRTGEEKSFREIYRDRGREYFRDLEKEAIRELASKQWCVISTGGSALMNPESRRMLRPRAVWVYLDVTPDVLWERVSRDGIPAFLDDSDEPEEQFARRISRTRDVLLPHCDAVVECEEETLAEVTTAVRDRIGEEIEVRAEAPNTFGDLITITTFGESHGPMVGAVLDGLPPGIEVDSEFIQKELDRRRPGQSSLSTQRNEADKVRIVSGVFEGKTTGTPMALLIDNKDSHSKDYEPYRDLFRPGHADFTFWRKYGIRDHRGGGRSSGRETAARVAGGAVARQVLQDRGVRLRACTVRIGQVEAERMNWDEVEKNPVRAPDARSAEMMQKEIEDARRDGDSVGGLVYAEAVGLPAGLGDPVFGKLDARLARAVVSIGAVKGVEFGAGFDVVERRGSKNNDEMADGQFLTNNAGGVLGGISSGAPLVLRAAIKPTPSVSTEQRTCDVDGENRTVTIEGRHDPCIAPRVVPVIENMMALVLLDAWMIQDRIRGTEDWPGQRTETRTNDID